jgi:hypothetical protein
MDDIAMSTAPHTRHARSSSNNADRSEHPPSVAPAAWRKLSARPLRRTSSNPLAIRDPVADPAVGAIEDGDLERPVDPASHRGRPLPRPELAAEDDPAESPARQGFDRRDRTMPVVDPAPAGASTARSGRATSAPRPNDRGRAEEGD